MRAISPKRLARLTAEGLLRWGSTFARSAVTERKRPRDTGPSREVKALIAARSGGQCEWPGCINPATDRHHRLNRKAGGRRGEMAQRINGAAWLLHCCRLHHRSVTSATGERLVLAREWGWVLTEGQVAELVPVHCTYGWVRLDNEGGMRHDVE